MTDLTRPYPTTQPPPMGGLAIDYFTPLVAPVPVATRLPQPGNTADTINGFLRVEACGGEMRDDWVFYDADILLHAYAPNNQESMAEQLMARALAWGNNAMGSWVTHPSTQIKYFVTFSKAVSLGIRQQDPKVNLTRFLGRVTWRLQGVYVGPT